MIGCPGDTVATLRKQEFSQTTGSEKKHSIEQKLTMM
jgi:hypothetical protein